MCELYRHYDGNGNLLYVGISLSSIKRLSGHKSKSAWFDEIEKVTIEKFKNRQDALLAERNAIIKERPIFNKTHNKGNADLDSLAMKEEPVDFVFDFYKSHGFVFSRFKAAQDFIKIAGTGSDDYEWDLIFCNKLFKSLTCKFDGPVFHSFNFGTRQRDNNIGTHIQGCTCNMCRLADEISEIEAIDGVSILFKVTESTIYIVVVNENSINSFNEIIPYSLFLPYFRSDRRSDIRIMVHSYSRRLTENYQLYVPTNNYRIAASHALYLDFCNEDLRVSGEDIYTKTGIYSHNDDDPAYNYGFPDFMESF